MEDAQLSELSSEFLKRRPKEVRSSLGQFLTPKILRDRLASQIDLKPGMKVLDPGVGTGEFLKTCYEIESQIELEGWDIDSHALAVAKKLVPQARLKNISALEQEFVPEFDVVIGNPPYFEIRNIDRKIKEKFSNVIGGRPNIFSLFFPIGLGMLKEDGVLGFVVPPSMNNGAYFSKLRNFIADKGSIEFLEIYKNNRLFEEVQTAVQLIIIRKGKKSNKFVLDIGALSKANQIRKIFSDDPKKIRSEFTNRTSIWNLGYEAKTGTIVWNQHKDKLSRERHNGAIPLIWAHNIKENGEIALDESHPKKKQYISKINPMRGPAIIVNRITGSVGSGNLRCGLIPLDFEFVGENHVNIIRKRSGITPLVPIEKLFELLRTPDINMRIQNLTGNTQISATELTYFIPLEYNSKDLLNDTLF